MAAAYATLIAALMTVVVVLCQAQEYKDIDYNEEYNNLGETQIPIREIYKRSLVMKSPYDKRGFDTINGMGFGKRSLDSLNGFGFGKRSLDSLNGFGFGKRSLDSLNGFGFGKRSLDSLNGFGFGKRSLDSLNGFGFGKRAAKKSL